MIGLIIDLMICIIIFCGLLLLTKPQCKIIEPRNPYKKMPKDED